VPHTSRESPFKGAPCQSGDDFLDRKLNPEYEFLNRYPSGFPTLAERYTEGCYELHVHMTGCPREYCAVFYRSQMDKVVGEKPLINTECRQIDRCNDQVEMSVLLDVSKSIEQPQKIIHAAERIVRTFKVLSVVRLQPLNCCTDRPIHSGKLGPDALGIPISRLSAQGEGGFAGGFPFAGNDEVPGEVIQNPTIVVECVAEAQGNLLGRSSDLAIDAPRVLQSFTLEIVNNYAWLHQPEANDASAKGLHVLVRPRKFGLGAMLKLPHAARS